MRQWIIVVSSLLLIGLVSGAGKNLEKDPEKTLEKPSEKAYPKKVTSLKKKPTKSPNLKSPIDAFKDLPDEDLEFIKELDKQFKVHGDKIKIKVERDNSTLKNSKRTVEGDLGYGYYNGETAGGGYDYPKPSFSFYPYSQQDIPSSAPGYQIKDEEQSTISIVPSYSYELKQTSGGNYESNAPFIPSQPHDEQESYQQQLGQEQGHGYQQQNEPVIVLRIPGPTKYASHLQVLLQQYLEIRAAQYLKILEDVDFQKQQQQQQQHHQGGQLQYEQAQEKPQEIQYQHQQEAPQSYGYAEQQPLQQQQQINYPAIDEVYQSYKGRHQESRPIVEQQYEEPAEYAQQEGQGHGEQQQQYYYMQVEQEQPAHAAAVNQGYQPIYYVAMPHPDYNQQASFAPSVPHGYVDDAHLPITENNPRNTHTKVHFTETDNHDHSTQYPLPSIQPFERHAPTPTPTYQPYQVDPHGEANEYQQQQQLQQQQQYQIHGQASNSEAVVSITQRPYNYHAHSPHGKNSKRMAAPAPTAGVPGEGLKKLHNLINRLRTPENNTPSRIKKEAV